MQGNSASRVGPNIGLFRSNRLKPVPPLSGVSSRRRRSHLLGAVGAVDVLRFDDEALVGQRQRALLAVEAVLVPGVALVVHHVGAVAEPCGGAGHQRSPRV